jgi:hypothetical protein
MTPESLSNWIFNTSGYKINYQDCKSRIENLCMKYADGDFEVQGKTNEERIKHIDYYGTDKNDLVNDLNIEIKDRQKEAFEAGQQWAVDAQNGKAPIGFQEWIKQIKN